MGVSTRSKVSLNEKSQNFIPDKDKSKLAESSEPANGTLSSLRQKRLNYARNMIIGHPDPSSIRNKFFDIKELVFNETEIC